MTARTALTSTRHPAWKLTDEATNELSRAEEHLTALEFMIDFAFADREPDDLKHAIKSAMFEAGGFIHKAKLKLETANEAL